MRLRRIIWKPAATWIDRADCRAWLDSQGIAHVYAAQGHHGIWRHTTVIVDRTPFRFAGERP